MTTDYLYAATSNREQVFSNVHIGTGNRQQIFNYVNVETRNCEVFPFDTNVSAGDGNPFNDDLYYTSEV